MWDDDEVKALLKKRSKRSREEELEAKWKHARETYNQKKEKYREMTKRNEEEIRLGLISEEDAAARLKELEYGWLKTKAKLRKLQDDLKTALTSGNSEAAEKAQTEIDDQQQSLLTMAVAMFEDSCRILHALYGDPYKIAAFDLPRYGTAKDHVTVMANVCGTPARLLYWREYIPSKMMSFTFL